MTKTQRIVLFLLRVALGVLFLYSGYTKVFGVGGAFSAAGYLNGAENFTGLFHWLASPAVLPVTNFLNSWGQLLLGVSLILGLFVRWTAVLGAVLMLLYWMPLPFPHPDAHSFIVDDHIVYGLAMLVLAALNAGKIYGLDSKLRRQS